MIHLFQLKKAIPIILFCAVAMVSCTNPSPEEQIETLNGYWEIKSVQQKNGVEKKYDFNETVDFIEINKEHEGFRKKVKPALDGSYTATGDTENIKVKIKDNQVILHYNTNLDNWKETLISAEEDAFTVENERGIVYTYKRFNGYLDDYEE